MFNEIDRKAEDLRSGNMGEEDVAKAFDDIVGTLDEEKPYEAVEIQDRNVGAELDSLAKNLETAASRATLQTDGDMQVWVFIQYIASFPISSFFFKDAIDYMAKDNNTMADALSELNDLKL
jgi:hypothetical protein